MLKPLTAPGSGGQRPRLLLVAAVPPPYHGTNMANLALIESDLTQRFETTLLDISDHRNTDNLGRLDLTNVRLALTHLAELKWYSFTRRPGLVYILLSQNSLAFLRDGLFILAARILGPARVVAHLHGGNFQAFLEASPPWVRWFVGFCLRRVDTGVVLGEALRPQLSRWVKRTVVVENGTDCLEDTTPHHGPGPVRRVLYLSSLFKSKGIVDLAQAIALLAGRNRLENVRIDIAGPWGDDTAVGMSAEGIRTEVEHILAEAGAASHVTFHGLVTGERKLALLSAADLFVLPSWNEGQPISILEAMAAGLPCVATTVGAIPETVLDGVTGLLVPPRDPERLAAALQRLLGDTGEREQMGREARRIYLEKYTRRAFVQRMQAVFEDTLAR